MSGIRTDWRQRAAGAWVRWRSRCLRSSWLVVDARLLDARRELWEDADSQGLTAAPAFFRSPAPPRFWFWEVRLG